MELKFVIFVVFATLTGSSCAQEQSTVYGLSAEESAQYHGIVDKQKTSYSTVSDGINPIFDILQILSLARNLNLPSDSFDYSTLITGAIAKAKISSDNIFTLIPIIVKDSNCPAAETGRIAAHGHLENVYANVGSAIVLALHGNSSDIRTQFEPFCNATKTSLAKLIGEYFATLRTCTNITNTDALAAIKAQETQSTDNIIVACDACFDVIKLFADGNSVASSTTEMVSNIESFRRRASTAMKNAGKHSYSPLRGIYISIHLNKPELAANFITDQYDQISTGSSYEGSATLVLDLIEDYLIKVKFRYSESCNGDESVIDDAQNTAAANFKEAARAHVASIPTKDNATRAAAQAALQVLNNFSDTAATALFSGIRFGRDQNSTCEEALRKIRASKAAYVAEFPTFVSTVFSLVQLSSNSRSNAAVLTKLQTGALQNTLNYIDNIFNAAEVLAQACHGERPVTDQDLNTLRATRDGAASAASAFISNLSHGRM